MPVNAVLFDLGDTLIFQAQPPNEETLYRRMADQVRPLMLDFGAGDGFDVASFLRELHGAVEGAQPARRASGREVDGAFITQGALASYGFDVSADRAAELWDASALDLASRGVQAYPDTLDTLRRLRALSIPTALVTNGTHGSAVRRIQLEAVSITDELLPVLVSSADLMRPKPDPSLFRKALSELKVEARQAVFVGDDLEADVRGAKALGMTTVWKLNGRHEVAQVDEADYAIHHLWELFALGLLPGGAAAGLESSPTPHDDGNAERY